MDKVAHRVLAFNALSTAVMPKVNGALTVPVTTRTVMQWRKDRNLVVISPVAVISRAKDISPAKVAISLVAAISPVAVTSLAKAAISPAKVAINPVAVISLAAVTSLV